MLGNSQRAKNMTRMCHCRDKCESHCCHQRCKCQNGKIRSINIQQDKPMEVMALAQEYVDFLNACKSPWHVVDRVKTTLKSAGFIELSMEDTTWNLSPRQKYYTIKGGSTILAFALGGRWTPTSRIALIAPHTDSPALRIKPNSNRGDLGFIQVGCGLYGGGFWHTWFDRDLGLAGRVYVKNGNSIESRLLMINKPIANVPSLAIHFDSTMNTDLKINFETQLLPMIGLGDPKDDTDAQHQPMLMNLLAKELNVNKEQILEFELNLFDTAPACIGGANDDFVFGQFQDNQYCSFVGLKALLDAINQPEFSSAPHVYMYATYNHEEVGSKSDVGAATDWTKQVLYKICGRDNYAAVINKSYALSADVDHGVHPNYSNFYEINSRPALNGGPVIKYNYSLEMASDATSAAIVREVGRRANVNIQGTIPINSKRTGSTLGPTLSAMLGIMTCDLGPPLLAMHSVRETSATIGVWNLKRFIEYFYREFNDVMDSFVTSVRPVSIAHNVDTARNGNIHDSEQSYETIENCSSRCYVNTGETPINRGYSPPTVIDYDGQISRDMTKMMSQNLNNIDNVDEQTECDQVQHRCSTMSEQLMTNNCQNCDRHLIRNVSGRANSTMEERDFIWRNHKKTDNKVSTRDDMPNRGNWNGVQMRRTNCNVGNEECSQCNMRHYHDMRNPPGTHEHMTRHDMQQGHDMNNEIDAMQTNCIETNGCYTRNGMQMLWTNRNALGHENRRRDDVANGGMKNSENER